MPKPGDIYYDPEKNILRLCMGKEYMFFDGCLDWRWAFITGYKNKPRESWYKWWWKNIPEHWVKIGRY